MPRPRIIPAETPVIRYDGRLAAEYRETLDSAYFDPIMLRITMLIGKDYGAGHRIATRSGVSPTTIRNWQLRKTHRPSASTLRFVARAVGYDLELVKKKLR